MSSCASPSFRKSNSQTSLASSTDGRHLLGPSADFCAAMLFLFSVVESDTGKSVPLTVDDFLLTSYKLHKRLRQMRESPPSPPGTLTYVVHSRYVQFAALLFQTPHPKSLFSTVGDTFVYFLNVVVLASITYSVCAETPASEAYATIRWYLNRAFPLLFSFPPATEHRFQYAIHVLHDYLKRTTARIEDPYRRGSVCLQRCLPQLKSKKYQAWCEIFRKVLHSASSSSSAKDPSSSSDTPAE